MRYKVLTAIGLFLLGLLVVLVGVWGTLAFVYAGPSSELLRYLLAIGFALVSLLTLIGVWKPRFRWRVLGSYLLLFIVVLMWYLSITPSNEREWQEDVAVLSYVTQKENLFTVHNIRNFSYVSETDYTPAYYDKTFDLEKLVGVDIIAVYWMGPAVAHVFVSFSFSDGEHLAVSIETRKEKGEDYSTLKGFFRQYELYYVVADERDVIGLRTNYRFDPVEDLYIYPIHGSLEDARHLFVTYMEQINHLNEHPEFYNTLTTNCTTNIWLNATASNKVSSIPFSWKILISGYVPEYLYEKGRLDTQNLSFEALKERVHVNERAKAIGIVDGFSEEIRKQ